MKNLSKLLFAISLSVCALTGCGNKKDNPSSSSQNSSQTSSDTSSQSSGGSSTSTPSSTTSSEENKINITVVGGTGSGVYNLGDIVTVKANVQEGFEFVNWTVDGVEVSTEETYTFTATESLTITANTRALHPMAPYTRTLTMSGKEFTVLNLTDIQLDNGNTIDFTKRIIDSCVSYKKPDLITVLGDIINDNLLYDADVICHDIFDLLESYQIPWAPIFGNHDQANYQDPSMSIKSIGTYELSQMLLNKTKYPHCLYMNGPSTVDGLSNYLINVKDSNGQLVESLIFMDSLKQGLNNTHLAFYEDCIEYAKELNNNVVVPSVVFDHIPLPQYLDEYNRALYSDYDGVVGCCTVKPIPNANIDTLFPKMVELGSTTTFMCGHDHTNSYYTNLNGINLAYALKCSDGCDPDENCFKFPVGGCYLTLDGKEDKIDYHPVNDFYYDVPTDIANGYDYHFLQVPFWRGSGAKLKFDIKLPDAGKVLFNICGTNFRRAKIEDAIGSWNRLVENVEINAGTKTATKGTLTPLGDNAYSYEIDLMDFNLNKSSGEEAYGNETAKLVYFHHNDMDYSIKNIRMEFEEVTETDQIDLSSCVISPIDDQTAKKDMPVMPEVEVKLNDVALEEFTDFIVKYSNNRAPGTATVKILPSGKGAHHYKGFATSTFIIKENPFRGVQFTNGFSYDFDDTPLTETFVFDVKFTSTGSSTMWFMLGDGWDTYFGYYGLKSTGELDDKYNGVSVQMTTDGYVRVTCVLSKMDKQNAGTPNPTSKVNLFYVHGSWGGTSNGYIDFDLSDAPEVVRGQAFLANQDTTKVFDKVEKNGTIIIDFKFSDVVSTHINFMIGNTADGWSHYNGYYRLNSDGTLASNYNGMSISQTSDHYIRLTIKLSELNDSPTGVTPPDEELGYNLFYIRGIWSDANGYFDFNPSI